MIFFTLCQFATRLEAVWRKRARKISVLQSQSSGPGFESRSDLDLFPGTREFKSSAMLVDSQLVSLRPIGILNNVMFSLNYLFQVFCLAPLAFVLQALLRVNKGPL